VRVVDEMAVVQQVRLLHLPLTHQPPPPPRTPPRRRRVVPEIAALDPEGLAWKFAVTEPYSLHLSDADISDIPLLKRLSMTTNTCVMQVLDISLHTVEYGDF